MSQFAAQIEAKSLSNLKASGVRRTQSLKQKVSRFAGMGFEVTGVTKGGAIEITPVDETEFWTEEDFEAHRAECHMSREEYYG